jgi:hypothetical protein
VVPVGVHVAEGCLVTDEVDPIVEMNELHVELGRKAAEKAMEVLDTVALADIPVATAVALLKFGVDLERKALLGVEVDAENDPFEQLLTGSQPAAPTEETPKEEK